MSIAKYGLTIPQQNIIYLFKDLGNYSDELFYAHLEKLPIWRKEKALRYKKIDDQKRSVLAFVLLQQALYEEYNITDVPEFTYNEFGKPVLSGTNINFSLSHCNNSVVCAISNHKIGVDIESVQPYNEKLARRFCTEAEFSTLEHSENRDIEYIKLWTAKEAISKYEGVGISLSFSKIDSSKYNLFSKEYLSEGFVLSVCTDRAEQMEIKEVVF